MVSQSLCGNGFPVPYGTWDAAAAAHGPGWAGGCRRLPQCLWLQLGVHSHEPASLQPRQGPALARHRLPCSPSPTRGLGRPSPGGSVSVCAHEPADAVTAGKSTSVCDERGSARGLRRRGVKLNPAHHKAAFMLSCL